MSTVHRLMHSSTAVVVSTCVPTLGGTLNQFKKKKKKKKTSPRPSTHSSAPVHKTTSLSLRTKTSTPARRLSKSVHKSLRSSPLHQTSQKNHPQPFRVLTNTAPLQPLTHKSHKLLAHCLRSCACPSQPIRRRAHLFQWQRTPFRTADRQLQ